MSKVPRILIVLATLTVQAAIATEPAATPRGIAPPTRLPDPRPPVSASGEPVATATMPREVRRAVVADAAKRFKVAESAVVLVHAEKFVWSDSALGCPEPGVIYTQMLVHGFRVVAKTSAGSLTYNTDSGDRAVICGAHGMKTDTAPVMDNEPRPYPAPAAPEK